MSYPVDNLMPDESLQVVEVIAWPCGTWCLAADLCEEEYSHMSDDYVRGNIFLDDETEEDQIHFLINYLP